MTRPRISPTDAPRAGPLLDPSVVNIAIVRLRVGLGDMIVTVPALRALRRARPEAVITMVTWPETAGVVGRFGRYIDRLLPFSGHPGLPDRPPPTRSAWDAFVRGAVRQRFDLAIQLYGRLPAANAVTEAVGARTTGGFLAPGTSGDLATHLPYPTDRHEVDRHLAALGHLGVAATDAGLEFALTEADRRAAAALLRRSGVGRRPYAVLHPGATAPSRRWPAERFAAVGDALGGDGVDVLVTGEHEERSATGAVCAAMSTAAVDMGGATELGSLATLLAGAAVVVTNDSGPAHLAAAVGAPTVTVFLAGDPQRWAPRGPRHRAATAAPGCQPCGHQLCPIDFRCATGLTPASVVAHARSVLRRGEPTGGRRGFQSRKGDGR